MIDLISPTYVNMNKIVDCLLNTHSNYLTVRKDPSNVDPFDFKDSL